MNEKIRKLAEQAGGFPCSKDEWGFYNEGVEKFAELIVRECVASIPSDGHRGDFCRAVEFCQQQIREHFGAK